MKYILENPNEFERLEKQSQHELYDFKSELLDLPVNNPQFVLDAGCGSGIVTRHLALTYPSAHVVGCDFSAERILKAQEFDLNPKNVHFFHENLHSLSFSENSFDLIVCRYVLEHVDQGMLNTVLAQLYKVLKPNGVIRLIDMDGYFFNLYPQTKLIKEFSEKFLQNKSIDLFVGRKFPSHLKFAGFQDVSWRIQTMDFHGKHRQEEINLITERFAHVLPLAVATLNSVEKARALQQEYLELLSDPTTVLFYNKFIVTARKPTHLAVINNR